VTNVTVLDTYYGVYEYYSNNSVIQNSVFSGVAYGGYFQQTSNITISDNTFSAVAPSYYVNPYYGFYLWDIDSSTVRGNTISGFNNGVYIDGYSASYDYWNYGTHYVGSYDYSSSATVYQNNFVNVATPIIRPNWGYTYSFDYRPGTDSYGSYIYDTSNPGTVFNLAAPDGGNYYSQFDESAEGCNNTNSDSFCDSAFIGSGGAVDNLPWTTQDGWATPADTTAPVITYTLTPSTADGANGWYKSNVTLAWSVTDPESSVTMTGCVDQNILADQGATTYSCSASSAGGSSGPVDVSIKRDATVPTVSLVGGPANGGSYYFGSVPAAPTCSALDALSGLDGSCTVSDYSALVGPQTVIATANDNAGNQNSASAAYTVLAWTLNGFYQPVDMGGVWNTVKNGSTVPLKFEVFAGSTELTSTSIVNQPLTATQTLCSGGPTDEIEILASGATSLRYDTASGQFIYNWQTPKKAGYCYVVTVKLADGTSISANFKLK
jgi:parallel beta-helix repeat protein